MQAIHSSLDRLKQLIARFRRPKQRSFDEHLVETTEALVQRMGPATSENMAVLQGLLLVDVQRGRAHERRLQESEARWKNVRRYAFLFMGLSSAIAGIILYLYRNGFELPASKPVAVVSISGEIGTQPGGSADKIIPSLRRAFENNASKAVVLRINSPGGLPVDAERVNRELEALKRKNPEKHVVAVIESIGASAAYMIAIHADEICVGRYSIVGSVGVIMSVWNWSKLAEKVQVTKEAYASGKFKAMLDPFREVKPDEREKVMSIVGILGNNFTNEVVTSRGKKLKLTSDQISTGEVWPGTQAVQLGLVDGLCTMESIVARYDGKSRDYGPFVSDASSLVDHARTLGAAFFDGARSAADRPSLEAR